MRLKTAGKSIFKDKKNKSVEVTNISSQGLWILLSQKEYFLPYKEFPWFKDAKVAQILNLELLHKKHLHWPDLDVDLDIQVLENLEAYPLVYK
jgi:hypothetical protein